MDADLENLLDDGPRSIGVMLLLADFAQVSDRKLNILGGGLSAIGPQPQSVGIAMRLEVPWDRANIEHNWTLELTDADGQVVTIKERPLRIKGKIVAGRPAGARPGTPLPVPLALNLAGVGLPPGQRYTFRLTIEGESRPDWSVSFDTRANTPKQSGIQQG